jgi:protein-disulfide isomerase
MRRINRVFFVALTALGTGLGISAPSVNAQFLGTPQHDEFSDTSVLHPPDGVRVGIIVFEDLGCPGCALAHPLENAVAEKYHVTLLRHDYPIPKHIWTFEAAVYARYLQDMLNNPKLAEEFRSDVFHSQEAIASKDDLHEFAARWFERHGLKLPSPIDPGGALAAKVQTDYDLGVRLNVTRTPTIVVVTRNNYQVVCGSEAAIDPTQLEAVVHAAVAQTKTVPTAKSPAAKHK